MRNVPHHSHSPGHRLNSRHGRQQREGALHRIAIVRRQQGFSERALATRLRTSVATIRDQENKQSDLMLSDLYKWQRILEVPIADLLVEPGPELSPNVQTRALLIKMMKTTRTLERYAGEGPMRLLVERLATQLIEIMPELETVDAWPSVGGRRSKDDTAAIEERMISLAALLNSSGEAYDID
jgi:transcriptional regulator with XRE-family HTH domain